VDARKRKLLEAAGWRFGDAADFLEMTAEERQLLDARINAALAVRRQREALNLSQKQLATRIKTSQPRMAKIERAAADVSLDQILRAFIAAGGQVVMKSVASASGKQSAAARKMAKRKSPSTAASRKTNMKIDLVGRGH
jgi:predicted XRE-type DNA-binding protein